MTVAEPDLRRLAVALLRGRGASASTAWLQADLLIEAELRGLPSHGVQRLPRLLMRIDRGLADPNATGSHHWCNRSFLKVDGKRALGPVALMLALEALVPATKDAGIALAAINNANHIGMLAYYAEAAATRGMIGIVLSTSEALVHPFGGTQAMLGTNPIAIGIPTGDVPFVLDLASSLVSMGKIHNHALRGKALPPGWAVDAAGLPTTEAEAAKTGAIAPFGEAKGYGLGLAFELMVAMLAGSELAPDVRGTLDASHPANKGDLLILIDPGSDNAMASRVAAYLEALRGSRAANPAFPVSVPGDRMRARRALAQREGINVPDSLMNELQALLAA